MKLPPATLLIIAMFGSFVLILTAMIAIFRPEPRPVSRVVKQAPTAPVDTLEQSVAPVVDTLIRADTTRQVGETPPPTAASIKTKAPIPPTAAASRKLYRDLERERREMAALRADMERRLRKAQADHTQKLAQLARRCEPLEPGEAVQILKDLRDEDIARVLSDMKPKRSAPIVVLLRRLGREKAIKMMKK